jgi:hypothetical protein
LARRILLAAAATLFLSFAAFSQQTQVKHERLTFEQAKSLLESDGAREANLGKRSDGYSLTRLNTGRVLELFYPIKSSPSSPRSAKAPRSASLAGYGVVYDSEASYREAMRPRHILEELLPDGQVFVAQVPDLIARLERRMKIGKGRLDYSRETLRRVDSFVSSYRRAHSTADTDPAFFQELTAYYGEVLRQETSGEWVVRSENIAQQLIQRVPNVAFVRDGARLERRPWSTVLNVLNNEDHRNLSLTSARDADLRAGTE